MNVSTIITILSIILSIIVFITAKLKGQKIARKIYKKIIKSLTTINKVIYSVETARFSETIAQLIDHIKNNPGQMLTTYNRLTKVIQSICQ